jgi:hypothetical protein
MLEISVVPIDRLELRFETYFWPFADERRAQIDAHWEKLHRERPSMWNGQVLMMHGWAVEGRVFRGRHFACDFASMLAWRDWEYPDDNVKNCFAVGAIRCPDGAFLLGVMSDHTANAGRAYFPAGMANMRDVIGNVVDFDTSVWRELAEETGLTEAELNGEPGWHTVFAGPRIGHVKILHANESAETLGERVLAFLARRERPQLSGVRIVRSPADFDSAIPPWVMEFLKTAWGV